MTLHESVQVERVIAAVGRWLVGGLVGLAVFVGLCAIGVALTIVVPISLTVLAIAGWGALLLSLATAALVAMALDERRLRRRLTLGQIRSKRFRRKHSTKRGGGHTWASERASS